MSELAVVLNELVTLAAYYAARQPDANSRLHADLGVSGGDFIEFVQEVERHDVDLSWVSPRDTRAEAQDPTLSALADDVVRQRG